LNRALAASPTSRGQSAAGRRGISPPLTLMQGVLAPIVQRARKHGD
jgi:hypothetical protein